MRIHYFIWMDLPSQNLILDLKQHSTHNVCPPHPTTQQHNNNNNTFQKNLKRPKNREPLLGFLSKFFDGEGVDINFVSPRDDDDDDDELLLLLLPPPRMLTFPCTFLWWYSDAAAAAGGATTCTGLDASSAFSPSFL